MKFEIPELSLVALVGAAGSGKSTLARKLFGEHEVLSSDEFRAMVSDNAVDQSVSAAAFDSLYFIARKRLEVGRLTVVDATNVQPDARKHIVHIARAHDVHATAIVLNFPLRLCLERNADRGVKTVPEHVVRRQWHQLRGSLRFLQKEGFRRVLVLDDPNEVDTLEIVRRPMRADLRAQPGPFDFIGDVHGCYDELAALLSKLGYVMGSGADGASTTGARHPDGRKAVFVGDLVDRGPNSPDVLRLVMGMCRDGDALCVSGNHESRLARALRGRTTKRTHGLAETLDQLATQDEAFTAEVLEFIEGLAAHYVLAGGDVVVAHAGMKASFQGRSSGRVRAFAQYGETTGEVDEYGLPVRARWADDYRGSASVVYGHTPVLRAEWLNKTICIDTGCVFGGSLTALRYPERELVSVPAAKVYYEPIRPLGGAGAGTEAQTAASWAELSLPSGTRVVNTKVLGEVSVRAEHIAAALEPMSRFAVDPRWLIYLPPTMSPSETSVEDGYLEHPRECLNYFAENGVQRVICEEKHMGSRAIVVLCRDASVGMRRFGIDDPAAGSIYTRTGRPFFTKREDELSCLARLRSACDKADLWGRLKSDWVCLDTEILPWSAKAQELLRLQYAPVAAAGRSSLTAAVDALSAAASRGIDLGGLLERHVERHRCMEAYTAAYRGYCWTVDSTDDLLFAPFHVLASEGHVHDEQDHGWHLQTIASLHEADPSFIKETASLVVDPSNEADVGRCVQWWTDMTESGGEGMVVKPIAWARSPSDAKIQVALKCRGREYLRIIYGPEYTLPEHLERLRKRGLRAKRFLASREYALGMEGLRRFVGGESLARVHECAFGVLAFETEATDPRL